MDFRVGDRIKVEFEGEVRSVHRDDLQIGGPSVTTGAFLRRSAVKKIAPALPTTPGSVIRYESKASPGGFRYRLLRNDGNWVCSDKGQAPRPFEDADDIEIIFDAGAK